MSASKSGMIKTVKIDDIRIVDRIRKDYGDLNELAQDIAKWGLINYPVVTPDNVLIAGERRIKACRMLGWVEIPVIEMTVRDYEHQLRLEISENENRKEFTISERLEYARRLEQIERLKARERQAVAGSRNLGLVQENFPELEKGQTRDKVAELVGFGSGKTYEKAKFVAEHGDPETIRKLDAGEISIHGAYQKTKAKLEAAERAAREAEARAEAERRRAEELAVKLAEAERRLAEAEKDGAEAERLRAEAERLRRELEELKARGPEVVERVVERVVEVPVEVVKPDPVLEAELEAARKKAAELLREKEWLEARFRGVAEEKEGKEVKLRALEREVEDLRRWLDHARKELEKERSRPRPRFDVRREEFRALAERAHRHAHDLADVLEKIEKEYADELLAAARVRGGPDLEDIAEAAIDAVSYKALDIALRRAAGKLNRVFDLLRGGKPELRLVKGGEERKGRDS